MGSFRIPVAPGRMLSDSFAEFPPSLRSYLKAGFASLGRLSRSQFDQLLKTVLQSIDSPMAAREDDLGSMLDVPDATAAPLLAAASTMAMGLAIHQETPEKLVKAAMAAEIVMPSDQEVILAFAKSLKEREQEIKSAVERSEIATKLLPALQDVEVVVDLRPSFAKGKVRFALPIVLVHMDTDAAHEELWFQASVSQVERMIETLKRALEQAKELDNWSQQKPTSRN